MSIHACHLEVGWADDGTFPLGSHSNLVAGVLQVAHADALLLEMLRAEKGRRVTTWGSS